MPELKIYTAPSKSDAVGDQLRAALQTLRNSAGTIPIERARAIASSASNIIETLKIEAQQSAIEKERS